ncbi:MAG TPA: hypothetical protein VEC09_09935 [Actinomycetota bacterium]|nr:hypothetical protein [Actinomycetota bacterium]
MERSRLAAQMLDAQGDAPEPWPASTPPPAEHVAPPRLTPIAPPTPATVQRDRVLAAARARLPEIERIARGLDRATADASAADRSTARGSTDLTHGAGHEVARLRDDLARARAAERAAMIEAAQIRDELALTRHRIADLEAQVAEASERIRELELVNRVSPSVHGSSEGHSTNAHGFDDRPTDRHLAESGTNEHAPPEPVAERPSWADPTLAVVATPTPTYVEHTPPAPAHVEHPPVASTSAPPSPEDVFPTWTPEDDLVPPEEEDVEPSSSEEPDVPLEEIASASANLEQVVEDAQSTLRQLLAKAAAARRGGPATP